MIATSSATEQALSFFKQERRRISRLHLSLMYQWTSFQERIGAISSPGVLDFKAKKQLEELQAESAKLQVRMSLLESMAFDLDVDISDCSPVGRISIMTMVLENSLKWLQSGSPDAVSSLNLPKEETIGQIRRIRDALEIEEHYRLRA